MTSVGLRSCALNERFSSHQNCVPQLHDADSSESAKVDSDCHSSAEYSCRQFTLSELDHMVSQHLIWMSMVS